MVSVTNVYKKRGWWTGCWTRDALKGQLQGEDPESLGIVVPKKKMVLDNENYEVHRAV